MTLKEMKLGVRYRVVDCAPRGHFRVGDIVWKDKDISGYTYITIGGVGGLSEYEWKIIRRCTVELDKDYYKKKMLEYMSILREHEEYE